MRTFNSSGEYQSENLNKRFLWDMVPAGNGLYSPDKSGRVWRPSNGKTYKARMTLKSPNALLLEGCLGPICPDQNWKRVN